MGAGLDFTSLCGGPCPFSEPGKYPGGISYGSISIDPATKNFTTDGTLSTLEIVNIMLGAGNDHLAIQSTLQPGGDVNPITGLRGELAHHGHHGRPRRRQRAAQGRRHLRLAPHRRPKRHGRPAHPRGRPHVARYGFQSASSDAPDGSYTSPVLRDGRFGRHACLLGGGRTALPARAQRRGRGLRLPPVTGTFHARPAAGSCSTNGQAMAEPRVRRRPEGLRAGLRRADDPGLRERRRPQRPTGHLRDGAILLVDGFGAAGRAAVRLPLPQGRYRLRAR
jgi:hypothetical protein